jgi:hypothetical protein
MSLEWEKLLPITNVLFASLYHQIQEFAQTAMTYYLKIYEINYSNLLE